MKYTTRESESRLIDITNRINNESNTRRSSAKNSQNRSIDLKVNQIFKESAVLFPVERVADHEVNNSACVTKRSVDYYSQNSKNLYSLNKYNKYNYQDDELSDPVRSSKAYIQDPSKETNEKSYIFRSKRNTGSLKPATTDNFHNQFGIKPAPLMPQRVSTYFEANYNDIDLKYTTKEQKSLFDREDSSGNDSRFSKEVRQNHALQLRNPNKELMDFMKTEIQAVKAEFMGALKDLTKIAEKPFSPRNKKRLSKDGDIISTCSKSDQKTFCKPQKHATNSFRK